MSNQLRKSRPKSRPSGDPTVREIMDLYSQMISTLEKAITAIDNLTAKLDTFDMTADPD